MTKLVRLRKKANYSAPVAEMYDDVLANDVPFLSRQGDVITLQIESSDQKYQLRLDLDTVEHIIRLHNSPKP